MPKDKKPEDKLVPEVTNIADVRSDALLAREEKIMDLLQQLEDAIDDGVELQDATRGRTVRVRGEDEKNALSSILDYVDSQPAAFQGLANRDQGHDPKRYETDLLRHRLDNAFTLSRIVDRFDEVRLSYADSALYVGSLVKAPILAAYEIAKPLANVDDANGKKLNPALNFYGAIARAGAKTRRENKKK
jgi:hypothetical protein